MLEVINHRIEKWDQWLKIKQDHVFEDIGNGWYAYKEVIEPLLRGRNVAVQAGGYCGIFPRCLSLIFNSVYTFEPDHLNFHCLVNNTWDTPNVIRFQAALGCNHDLISVYNANPHNAGEKVVHHQPDSIIPTLRIDDLELKQCDLIMLDIEGFELNALNGSSKTLSSFLPVVSVENTNSQIEDLLFALRYKKIADVYWDTIYAI